MAINFARRLFIYTYIHLEDAYGTYHALKDLYDEGKITVNGICGTDTWKKVVEHMKANTK